eukprot:CAMPEP_0117522870 /NCGR_PEP_ID=MMETSP0784-20121206/34432_1 /TAXON_ID=39447 /ORGANISM="" /LENGTH=49 /DNA_ID= /DNA_START= /DNA_END= /DNA_ORIENTATION=
MWHFHDFLNRRDVGNVDLLHDRNVDYFFDCLDQWHVHMPRRDGDHRHVP